MDPHVKFGAFDDKEFGDIHQYQRLVGKLIYLTVTRPDISFVVGVVSQFMQNPKQVLWDAACRILRYLKSAPGKGLVYCRHGHTNVVGFFDADWAVSDGDRRSTTGYCTFFGGNLVNWKSKKQTTVARSSAEAEYKAMAHTATKLMWVRSFLIELGYYSDQPMEMYSDNQAAIYIANNPVFHEWTKHIEVDCHFVRVAVQKKLIVTPFVRSQFQLGDMFTKALFRPQFLDGCSKLVLDYLVIEFC
ncbi:secreted RxLR effector protein 161-like [Telopea speciosissima]|uniref:secreted RxLR effector protein 161-like n=1 Tax=Telopea speciosissima TaxID=54955 RepID=UPI001CC5E65B|nr:secreted RxLR effector protein 161-like [Telopea speciosissima]